jgi:hypothetical protein
MSFLRQRQNTQPHNPLNSHNFPQVRVCVSQTEQKLGLEARMKTVSCSVHGQIELPQSALQIIDTPQFQRLRNIKQLGELQCALFVCKVSRCAGTTSYVFPSAVHTRFEHSLGVFHLARKMARHLKNNQPELDIDDRDVKLVSLSGLCHGTHCVSVIYVLALRVYAKLTNTL